MKTIAQASKEYAERVMPNGVGAMKNAIAEIFADGIKFSQTFIPITEKLPEEEFGFYKPVLVLVEGSGMYCSAAFKNGRFIPDNPVIEENEITHWRPIELT